MRWILLGALLALLLLFPAFGAVVLGVAVASVSQPLLVAFAAGILARPYVARRGWLR